MWWLFLLTILALAGYYIYSRKTGSVGPAKGQGEMLQDLVDKEMDRIRKKKQRLVDRAAKEGKTIPLAQIVEPLEKSKEVYKGDTQYVAAVDRTINELRRRYKTEVPVDEAYQLQADDEDEGGM